MFKSKKVAVLGFGLEGKDLVNFLLAQGTDVFVFDKKEKSELILGRVAKDNVTLTCGKDYLRKGLTGFDVIFRSPGVYRFLPEIVEAEKGGARLSSAIKLFFELCPAKIIGVTGTKGKGTASSLIYEMLLSAGKDVYLAGNIGVSYLKLLPKLTRDSWVVLELSSFQLIDMNASPYVAVVLNITQDHLDWHKDLNEYVESKKNIVKHQKYSDFAVINIDYETPESFSKLTRAKVFYFSRKKKVNGAYCINGKIYLSTHGAKPFAEIKSLLLRGEHNLENITAALTVGEIVGVDPEKMRKVIYRFKGLEHRMELVGEVGGVKYYNDSFATGPQPTSAAINSFIEPLTLILGGYDKGLDYKELIKLVANKKNIKNVILIGDLSDKLEKIIVGKKYKGTLVILGKETMTKIVNKARSLTPVGGVVLLSPAAASFDMFRDYKERGKKFKEAVFHL